MAASEIVDEDSKVSILITNNLPEQRSQNRCSRRSC